MKKCWSIVLALVLLTFLISCQSQAATWQEQYDLGVRYLSEGNYEEAIIAFTAAIEIDPKRPDTYIGLYEAYVAVGDYESAQAIITSGRQECGNSTVFDAAQSSLDKLLSNDPKTQMYIDSERFSEALRSGALTFDDVPEIFFTPFNQLGNIVGLVPEDVRTTTQSGSFNGIEYDDLVLQECAYDYEPDHLYGWSIKATAPLTSSDTLDFTIDNSNAVLNGEDISEIATIPAGWKNISIGDSMATVLTKLGLDPALSKYSSIDLFVAEDMDASNAWVDTEARHSIGDTPIVYISIQFVLGNDNSSNGYLNNGYHIRFDFIDGGPLSKVYYSNHTLLDALLNGSYESSSGIQANDE